MPTCIFSKLDQPIRMTDIAMRPVQNLSHIYQLHHRDLHDTIFIYFQIEEN